MARSALLLVHLLLILSLSLLKAAETPPLQSFPSIQADPLGTQIQDNMIWTGQAYNPGATAYFVAFRKSFDLSSKPNSAFVHLFANARYLLWVNGQYVERGPARFQPNGPEYDSVPIANQLQPGKNVVVLLILSNGSGGKIMKHASGLGAVLEINGDKMVTDESWKWSAQTRYRLASVSWANITESSLDATVEDGEWMNTDYDDSKWETARKIDGAQWGTLTARRIPLLRDTPLTVRLNNNATLPVTMKPGDKISFDFDKLVQAYTVIEMDATAGSELTLDHQGVTYKAKAGKQTFITVDSRGFTRGGLTLKSGQITVNKLQLIERLYPYDLVASFHSNDELLNKIWAMCARSGQVLTEDSFVDCADRERVEWMDDDPPGYDIARTDFAGPGTDGKPWYSDPRIEHEIIRRTALTLQPGGWVKAHTCSDRYDIHAKMEDRACDWVEGIRRYYDATHDSAAVKEIWPAVEAQLKYFMDRRTSRGLVLAREWVVWGNPVGYDVLEGAGINAFVYKALVDAAYLARETGNMADATKFDSEAKDLAKSFNDVLWDEQEGTYYAGYFDPAETAEAAAKDAPSAIKNVPHKLEADQHLVSPTVYPALFALDQGIVPPDRRDRVIRYVLKNAEPKGRVMIYYYLAKTLYSVDAEEQDKFVLDIFRKNFKGMALGPNFCSWEDFGGGSHAHIYGMYPGYFLNAYVLGVRRDEPVIQKTLLIEPHLGDLTMVEGKVATEFGLVSTSWTKAGNELDFKLNVPSGITTTLALPDNGTAHMLLLNGSVVPTVKKGNRLTVNLPGGIIEGSLKP